MQNSKQKLKSMILEGLVTLFGPDWTEFSKDEISGLFSRLLSSAKGRTKIKGALDSRKKKSLLKDKQLIDNIEFFIRVLYEDYR